MGWFKKKGLVESAAKGELSKVNDLLKSGINPDTKDLGGDDTTPLFMAAANGHDNVVKILIAAGANVNAATEKGLTPLMLAAFQGSAHAVLTLLEAGANANAQDYMEETALMYAVKPINILTEPHILGLQCVIVKTLLAFGADPKIKNWSGKTVLDVINLISNDEMKRIIKEFFP